MRARRLHKLLVLLTFCLSLGALPARAAWIEVGPGGTPTPAPPPYGEPLPTPTPVPPHHDHIHPPGDGGAIGRLLGGAYLGSPYGWGGLTIVPVHVSHGSPGSSFRSMEQAMRDGDLVVRELGPGSVPTVEVENRGAVPVFLLAGEIILGGKQDRVIREDTVIAPHSGPVHVPVYCVEQGRWAPSAGRFEAAPHAMADSALRSKAAAGAGQDEVWAHVARESEASGVASPTDSYGDVVASPEVARRLDEYVARCPRPAPWRGRAVGAIFLAGGEILGVDLFDDPGLLSALWPKLVRSYAARAIGHPRHIHGGGAESVLAALRAAPAAWDGWAGSAARFRLAIGGYDAWAVTWGDAAVHVAALPAVRHHVPPPPPPPPPPPYDPYEPYPRMPDPEPYDE